MENVLNKAATYKQDVIKAIEVRNFGLIEGLEIDQEIKKMKLENYSILGGGNNQTLTV